MKLSEHSSRPGLNFVPSKMTHMPGRGGKRANWIRDDADPMAKRAIGRELGYLAQREYEQRIGKEFYNPLHELRGSPVRTLSREEIEQEYGK